MKRGLTLASVLVAVYLVVSVAPVASMQTSEKLVVGSSHDTQAEFENAQTLANLTVTSAGDGAVELTTATQTIESFEDGNLGSAWTGETGFADVVSSPATDGDYAAYVRTNVDGGDHTIASDSGLPNYPAPGETFAYYTQFNSTDQVSLFEFARQDSDSHYTVIVDSGTGDALEFRRNENGAVTTIQSTPATFSANTWYEIEVQWGTDGSFTVTATEVASGTQVASLTATDTTYQSSGGIALRSFSGNDDVRTYFDGISIGEQSPDAATYISATHEVSNAEEAHINITEAQDVSMDLIAEYYDGSSWTVGASWSASTPGEREIGLPTNGASQWRVRVEVDVTGDNPQFALSDESILFTNHAPAIDDASASPQNDSEVSTQDVTLSIDIGDQEFGTAQGETVDVTFYDAGDDGAIGGGDDSVIGTDTLTANGTATTSWTTKSERAWYVTAEDSYGSQETTGTFSFKAPGTLYLRNETNVSQLVNTSGVSSIKFYTDPSDSNAKIYDRPVENGKVNLTGLPTGTPFVATIDVDGYYPRQIYIPTIFEQSSVFLLNKSEPAVENIFVIDDRTGMYPPGDSVVVLQKGVNRSQYSTGGSGLQWTTIAGDRLGADNQYVGTLRQNDRYRILIENQNGDQRVLGEYPANLNGTVQLEVGNLKFDFADENQTYQWDANYQNLSGNEYVTFNFSDPTGETTDLTVEIYEQGNTSHTLAPAQTFTGPLGNRSIMEPVPASENETTWVVSWEATRNGKTIHGQHTVGSQIREQIVELDDWIQNAVAILFIILTGALGSQLNKETIAIATALVSGGFWYAGWLPAEAGAAVVIALFIAVFYKSAKSGGSFT